MNVLGLEKGRVVVVPYDAQWPLLFNEEARRISEVVGRHVLDIQHIGSTSIPGLSAKPILDIAVAVDSFEKAVVCVTPIVALGYRYLGENGIPRRRYFEKGTPITHHLHMFEISGFDWQRHLQFRDLLRADAHLARKYTTLKDTLCEKYPNNISAYQKGKTAFIRQVQKMAQIHRSTG